MPSNNVPTPESFEQLLGDALSSYAAKMGISDFNVGSAVTSYFEVSALMAARSSGDLFQILRDYSVIRATGSALQRLAAENRIIPITAAPATGYVTVIDLSFVKISSQVYAGTPPPNIGSTSINVGDASLFPASGSIYIGRGTPNVEGPLAYASSAIALTGSTTITSQVITGIPTTSSLLVGYPVLGAMIPAGTTIQSIDSNTQITLTLAATSTAIGASLTYTTPPVSTGNFWTLTLSAPTTKFHNLGETVIVAHGGNRSIPVNSAVSTPATGSNASIAYAVSAPSVILDGETTVTNVPVTAQLPGTSGNVPIGTIKSFTAPPPGLTNSSVTNPLSFTTGTDTETDDRLRTRIINKLSSIGLGTAFAVESGVIGAQASDEPSATLVSDDLLQASYGAVLYIDDGTGYEAKTAGVGIESIVDSAIGGEQFFQLATGGRQAPVAKAFLISTLSSPFDLIGGDSLAIVVGGQTYQHNFVTSDFRSPGSATAYEITASINGDTLLGFEATTSGNGSFVVLRDKTEGNDSIQITLPVTTGRDAAIQLGFPSSQIQTLRLYKNQIPLSKDGKTATIDTSAQALWSPSISNGDTLILSVDGTASITYTILNTDFIATGLYTSVSALNSLASWVEVLNNKLTGVTAEAVGDQLTITSNLLANNRAQVVIDAGSTLVTKGMFSTAQGLSSQGSASDYTLNRNTAQFELVVPLVAKDNLAAGTLQTEARLQSTILTGGSITFAPAAYLWLLIDSPGKIIQTGVTATSLLTVSKPSAEIIRYTSNVANAFGNVQLGDYLIVWTPDLIAANRVEGRVHAVTPNTLDVLITPAEWAAVTPVGGVLFTQGFVVVRTKNSPQKFEVPAGTYTLDQIAAVLQAQNDELNFTVLLEEYLIINTLSKDPAFGSLLVVTSDAQGQLLGFVSGTSNLSKDSLLAFYDTKEYDAQMPLFVHSTFAAGTSAGPPDTFIQSFQSSLDLTGRNPNELIAFLQPYGLFPPTLTTTGTIANLSNQLTGLASIVGLSFGQFIVGNGIPLGTSIIAINGTTVTMSNNAMASGSFSFSFNSLISDTQPYGEWVQESYPIPTTTVNVSYPNLVTHSNLDVSRDIRRLRGTDGPTGTSDRYFIASPLDFGPKDTAVVVIDNNPSLNTFEIPLYRIAVINTTLANNPSTFNAFDFSAGPTTPFTTNWEIQAVPTPVYFDFGNFKVLMQAKRTLTGAAIGTQSSLLFRSSTWGEGGTFMNVGYVYPSAPNLPIDHTTTVSNNTTILINLASGAAVSSAINSTTEWNVTIVPNTPVVGMDQVTYAYSGTGTTPALTLVGGEYVNITIGTEFSAANIGVFRISTQAGFTPTATQFTVQRPTGIAVAEPNRATNVNGAITFYNATPTTAAAINTHINANMSQYFTTTIVNDGGITGSGVIALSTFDNSVFTQSTLPLMDGVNWIAVSNLGGSPQFTFKEPLTYFTDGITGGYTFNNGEQIRLSPTTMDQVKRFTNILAVTGFTTEGTIQVADRGNRLELSTHTIGSAGAIQIIGGLANGYSTPILDTATRINNTMMNVIVNNVAGQGIQSDQWFRLQAANAQAKETLVSSNTSVTIIPDYPIVGQSTVELLNRTPAQRYFGKPRNVQIAGDTFKIEKQGSLVCMSWTGNGPNPMFSTPLNFNDTGGGTINIAPVIGTSDYRIINLTGNSNFTQLSIGDLVAVAGSNIVAGNTSTFLVTGVSSDGTVIQLLNPKGVAQFSFGTFTVISTPTNLDTVTVEGIPLTAVTGAPGINQFQISGTNSITAANLSALIGTLPGVTSSVTGSIVTITATTPSASIALASSNLSAITKSGTALVGITTIAGTFSANSQVSEGDTLLIPSPVSISSSPYYTGIFTSPFNVLNQGKFRVIRGPSVQAPNSVWFENSNVVEEEVTLLPNPINLTFDSTTSFNIDASGGLLNLFWNGTGLLPNLGVVQSGDIVTLGAPFSAGNLGSFMVTASGIALQQITTFTMPSGTQLTPTGPGQKFNIWNAGNVTEYYVWFQVNGSNSDPGGPGTGIMVSDIGGMTSFSSQQIALQTAAAIAAVNGGLDFSTFAAAGNGSVTVTTLGSNATNIATAGTMSPPFSISTVQLGRRTFLQAINPAAVNQSGAVSVVLSVSRPQIQFFEYEATVPGDLIVFTNNAFLVPNIGSWTVVQVVDQNTAIITGTRSAITNVSLNGIESSFFVKEGVPYTGYKHVLFTAAEPGSPTNSLVTFDTNAQSDKINQTGGVVMVTLNKLNYNTIIKLGLDSYRYNTGLIAEANRLIYGDPRDSITYPGIGAAGANIFVREPLSLRVQVALEIRLKTGVPFAQTSAQVRNAVSSLIKSNPLGVSISISSIVSVVQAIPGIISVAVSFPAYSPTLDLIPLTTGQKAFIVDPTTDISVSQIGT
jgi:uncharacterized phage protein gp47/JayE